MTIAQLFSELHPLLQLGQVTENVGSYMELYTTLYGLKAGEEFFSLFWSLGVFKLIFGVIAWMTVIEGIRIGGADGGWFIIRTLGMRFLGVFLMLAFFVWPTGTLDIGEMRYLPPPTFATANNPPTTPVTVFTATNDQTHGARGFALNGPELGGAGYNIKVPAMLRLMMMFGHGMNNATTKVLPDRISMRLLDQSLARMQIEDGQLKADLGAFNVQCYIPAVNKWTNFWRDKPKPAELTAREEAFGQEDIGWMGSGILLGTPGLYMPCNNVLACGSSLQASEPIQGFAWDNSRDGVRADWMPQNTPGRPYCNNWWRRLETRVYEGIGSDTLTQINAIMGKNALTLLTTTLGGDTDLSYDGVDVVVKVALSRSNVDELFSDDLSYYTGKIKQDTGTVASIGKAVSKGAITAINFIGTTVSTPFASAENQTQNNLAQITQSIVLLALYLAFPFVAVFSGMRFQVMVTYCILVMSVINWQMWWTITQWVDSNLLMSMYPDDGSFAGYMEELGTKRQLLDRTTNGLAMFAPTIWTFILSIAGWKGADALSGVTKQFAANNREIAKKVAQQGMETVQKIASMVPGGASIATGMSFMTGKSAPPGKAPSSGRAV